MPGFFPCLRFSILLLLFYSCAEERGHLPFSNRTEKMGALPVITADFFSTPLPGFYFLTTYKIGNYGDKERCYQLILDETGNIIYYKKSDPCFDFKIQPNGLISYFGAGRFYFINGSFKKVDSVSCINGVKTDLHDLCVLPTGNILLLGTETLTLDLSAHKLFCEGSKYGSKRALVESGVIQELDLDRKLVFEWHAKDHFKPEEADGFFLNDTAAFSWTHMNAIEPDGNDAILVTVRNFNEVTKISKKDGAVVWRLGGARNQFRFEGDSLRLLAMHDARKIKNGHLTIYDNGHGENALKHHSRVVEYQLDEKRKIVTLKSEHRNNFYSIGRGNYQSLEGGWALINFGEVRGVNATFEMLDRGKSAARFRFEDTLGAYRAFFYTHLPFKLNRPEITSVKTGASYDLSVQTDHERYLWSTGDTTKNIRTTTPGRYFVFVPAGEGFISSQRYVISDL